VDPLESTTNNRDSERIQSKKAERPSGISALTPVYIPSKEPSVDIILVHGLNGTALKTWTSESRCFWPVDLLPKSLAAFPVFPRILTYSYDASKGDDILSHAKEMAETVASDRKVSYSGFHILLYMRL
jgi:hypothetical protein